jgi:CO/xanthine dehydrogenase Mo-binding subunit
MEKVSIYIADTALTPLAGGTFATRQLYMSGNATLKTATELRERMAAVGADLLGAEPDDLVFTDGNVSVRGADHFLSLAEVVRACESRGVSTAHLGTFHAERGEFDPRTGRGRTFPDYTYGCHAVEVAVDPEAGEVAILRYVACHDVGRAINPMRVERSDPGRGGDGHGYALSEEIRIEEGTNLGALFADYLIPPRPTCRTSRPSSWRAEKARGRSTRGGSESRPSPRPLRPSPAPWPMPSESASTSCRSRRNAS